MTTNAVKQSAVHGIGHDGPTNDPENPGILQGLQLKILGQTNNTIAGQVANQQCGTVTSPALTSTGVGQITITNTKITTKSRVFYTLRRRDLSDGGTTPAGGAIAALITNGSTITTGQYLIDVRNALGQAATLSTDYVCDYLVINGG